MIIPDITKRKLPQSLRWAVRYTDLEACLVPWVEGELYLDVHFANHNRDYATGAGYGPEAGSGDGALNLVTMLHRPDMGPLLRSPSSPLPPDVLFVEAFVWAISREGALAQQVHREVVREALAQELASLTSAGLFRERWVVQVRAVPEPDRLECLRTRWTGLRKEGSHSRFVSLEAPA